MQIVKNCRELKMFLHKNKLTVLKIQTTEERAPPPPLIHLQNISNSRAEPGRKARSQELNLYFPGGRQEPGPLSHHLLPFRVCISRKLASGAKH